MNRLGRSELNNGKHRTISATLDRIDAVTADEVNAIARQLLGGPAGRRWWDRTDPSGRCRARCGR